MYRVEFRDAVTGKCIASGVVEDDTEARKLLGIYSDATGLALSIHNLGRVQS